MKTKFIEATNGPQNWGKFMVARFEADEWAQPSWASLFGANAGARGMALLRATGWTPEHLLVLDLQTGEGAIFRAGGLAKADLDKHQVWVCPLFEPFLAWLYEQELSDLDVLPSRIDLPDAPFALSGYRRPGLDLQMIERLRALTEDEDTFHPVGCSAWREEAQYVIDWAIEQLGPT